MSTGKLQRPQKTDPKNAAVRNPEEAKCVIASGPTGDTKHGARASGSESEPRASSSEGHETATDASASGEENETVDFKRTATSTKINGPEELARV